MPITPSRREVIQLELLTEDRARDRRRVGQERQVARARDQDEPGVEVARGLAAEAHRVDAVLGPPDDGRLGPDGPQHVAREALDAVLDDRRQRPARAVGAELVGPAGDQRMVDLRVPYSSSRAADRAALPEAREKLNEYCRAVNTPVGALGKGLSISLD